MKFEIKHRFTGAVLFALETESLKLCLQAAVKSGSNLSGSNLSGSDLSGSDLSGSDLRYSDLSGSNLSGSDLSGSDLRYSNLRDSNLRGSDLSYSDLSGSDLSYINLSGSDLSYINLRDSNLSGSNLSGSNLSGSDLRYSDLRGSDLRYSDLSDSNLRDSNLRDAKGADLAIAMTRILPEGDLIGWKKCNGVIVKLRIPEDAKRSSAFGRKCRAEFADVLEIVGAEEARTTVHGPTTVYRVGERVYPDKWDSDWMNECSNGIHFYVTRLEAENL